MSHDPGVSVLVPRHRFVPLLAVVFALTLTVPAPLTQALHGNAEPSIVLCGTVENAAGWPLEGVTVTAYGRGLTNSDHAPPPGNITAADGSFALEVLADFYRLVFDDPEGRAARAGATYLVKEVQVAGHAYSEDTCSAEKGVKVDPVVLEAPLQGFLEVAVTDAIDGASLAGAEVDIRVLGTATWGRATTDAFGIARITCPLHVPITIGAAAADHDAAARDAACGATVQQDGLSLWRTPVALHGVLTDPDTDLPVPDATVVAAPQLLELPDDHPYTLQGTSGDDGAYGLALPWSDTYDVSITRGGYKDLEFEVGVTPDLISDGIKRSLFFERADRLFSGTVTDISGTGIFATITLQGPAPANDPLAIPVAADGTFGHEIPVGDYVVWVNATGKNPRDCALSLPYGAEQVLTEGCLVLISEGKGAVFGILQDNLTALPLDDVAVTTAETDTTTDSEGRFAMELTPGTHTLTFTRAHFVTTTVDVTVAEDQVLVNDPVSIGRETVQKTVVVQEEDGTLVRDALVCPTFVPDSGDAVVHDCARSDDQGEAVFDLQWTSIGGAYDIGDYTFTAGRTSAVPFYGTLDCIVGLDVDLEDFLDPSPCVLEEVPAVATPVGPFTDAHTGLPVTQVEVTTTLPGGVSCETPYVCATTSDADGDTTLLLPEGFTFTIDATHPHYRTPAHATEVAAGTPALTDVALARVAHGFIASVHDAHTDRPLADATLTAQSDILCDPDGTFTCSAVTDEAGAVLFSLPWGTFDIAVPAGAYRVVRDAGFDDFETDVAFHGAALATDVTVPGTAEAHERLVRVAADPIRVAVDDFSGALVPGATLTVASERFGPFVCDPAENDGLEPGYAACSATHDAANGTIALGLPGGTADDHTWSLRVEAPDHFREERFAVPAGAEPDITLWPLTFDLTVDPVDVTSGETAPLVVVCVRNVDEMGMNPNTPPPAETCKSSGVEATPLLFADLPWRRGDGDDTTDRFMVRAAGTFHFPSTTVALAGPAAPHVQVGLVPIDPTTPEPEADVVTGRVVDLDAAPLVPGEGVGVVGARVFAMAHGGCPVGMFEGASGLDGSFQIPVLCHGDYEVNVADARYQTVAPQNATVPAPGPLTFALDRVVQEVVVTVRDLTTASPVAGARVALDGLDVTATATGVTGQNGTVAFTVPWGTYAVAVTGPDATPWVMGDATSLVGVSHTASAAAEVVLVSEPVLPSADTCSDDAAPDVCAPASDDGSVRLVSVAAGGADGQPQGGNWLLVPPQLGATPLVGAGSSVTPSGYAGPHAGTWTLVYTPPSMAGLSGVPPYPIEVRLGYTVDGEERSLEAVLESPVVGPSPFVSPVLTWAVNLHTERSIGCFGPMVSCGGDPDPQQAQAARFFAP